MIDISRKYSTLRTAVARTTVRLQPATAEAIREGRVPKGDPFAVAKVAAIQAAKNTHQIIPYCHPLPVEFAGVEFGLRDDAVVVTTTVKAVHKTGVEMEALTAASVAALTLYDMLKMLDETMVIEGVVLLSKQGGKSDYAEAFDTPPRAAVLVMSDSVAAGEKGDRSGRLIADRLAEAGVEVVDYRIVPDDLETIVSALTAYADEMGLDLVMTTGGTGFGPRDNTPEAMARVIEREAPGIPEAARAYGQARTPRSMLSRGKAGIRGKTVIINLPGSSRGVTESLDALLPGIFHGLKMLRGETGHGKGQG